MQLVTIKEAAKAHKIHMRTVKRVIERAQLIAEAGDLYDAEQLSAAISAYSDQAKVAGVATKGSGDAVSSATNTLAQAKAEHVAAQTRRLELYNLEKAGQLVDREHVKQMMVGIAAGVRTALRAVPSRVASKMLGLQDAGEAQRILADAIDDALGAFVSDERAEQEEMI